MTDLTWQDLQTVPTGTVFVFDVECYKNYFLIAFEDINTHRRISFEITPVSCFDYQLLRWFLWRYCLVGFNSLNYDILMIALALDGATLQRLKDASDEIVFQQTTPWDFKEKYQVSLPMINHVDLMEVAPLSASLKLYGGRLHCKTMQELPYPHDTELTQQQAQFVKQYCFNDLEQTYLLLMEQCPHIALRDDLGKEYGSDFRSLSDAQVAEAVIGSEIKKATGRWPGKNKNPPKACTYDVPPYMAFQTDRLKAALSVVQSTTFAIGDSGHPTFTQAVADLRIPIGSSVYQLSMGGLHSTEESVAHIADNETLIVDIDVASYYPKIILNQRLFPAHLGEIFLTVYEALVVKRLAAKKAKNKKIAEGLKIAINGIFGKLGSLFSIVYSPELLLQVTLSGQLTLLMLIEMLELCGISVVSANTDGIIVKIKKDQYAKLKEIVKGWESFTGFETEETRYKAVYSRDVNNYIAVKDLSNEDKGDREKRLASRFLDERLGIKTKGAYCERGSAQNSVLSRNPESFICIDAMLLQIAEGKAIEETIKACKDIRRFVSIRRVKGGAVDYHGNYLGKFVRWYYAKKQLGCLSYKDSGNKVPKTDGAKACMTLPDELPQDIDYARYIVDTVDILHDIGYLKTPKTASLF